MRFFSSLKVYFHLGSYDDALSFALGAENLFNVCERSEYVDTIICELPSLSPPPLSMITAIGYCEVVQGRLRKVLMSIFVFG